ncbi:MAG: hypothetical protein ACE366_27940 [Bradymonadia bacterium]
MPAHLGARPLQMATCLLLSMVPFRGALSQTPAPGDAAAGGVVWHTHGQIWVDATRWRSPHRREIQDTTVVRHRLRFGAYNLIEGEPRRARLEVDLEIGADLGPPGSEVDALPYTRRATFDLRSAQLQLEDIVGPISLSAGRLQLFDPAGFDALDGARVTVALPHVHVHGAGGWAAHRRTWGAGPDQPTPEGVLPDPAGRLYGLGFHTQKLPGVQLQGAWRQRVDGDGRIERSLAGAQLVLGALGPVSLQSRGTWDLYLKQPVELSAGADATVSDLLTLSTTVRRRRPIYAASSIWSAFDPRPFDALSAQGQLSTERWRGRLSADLRQYADDGRGQAVRFDGQRLMGAVEAPGHVGVWSQLTWGHGGAQLRGDLNGAVPFLFERGEPPVWLRGRIGVVHSAGDDTLSRVAEWSGTSGWLLMALRWPASETAHIECVAESHHSAFTPARMRVMARIVAEEWL